MIRSLSTAIQTIGRAARNAEGMVILYADTVTRSMRSAMDETERRRKIQDDYNKAHGIVPPMRSSICPATGRTSTLGSSRPVGRMTCSTIWSA